MDIDVLFAARSDAPAFKDCTPIAWGPDADGFLVPHAQFWQRDFLVAMVCDGLGVPQAALRSHVVSPRR